MNRKRHGSRTTMILHCILIPLSCIGFCLFGVTLFRHILNIGNGTGLVLSAILLLIGIFPDQFSGMIHRVWQNRGGKIVLSMVLLLILLVAALAVATTAAIVRGASEKAGSGRNLIVLGCQVRGTTPSQMLVERIAAAEAYLKENPDSVCIVSGGQGPDENITEARCMRDELVKRGISGDRIYMEERSTSTRENLMYSLDILEENGLGNEVGIVTNEFHEYRARRIAGKLGIRAEAVPAKTAGYLLPTFFVREQYGVLYEWVTG